MVVYAKKNRPSFLCLLDATVFSRLTVRTGDPVESQPEKLKWLPIRYVEHLEKQIGIFTDVSFLI